MTRSRKDKFIQLTLIGVCLTLVFACGKNESTKPERQPTPLDLSTTGTVTGSVLFDGAAPEPSLVQLSGWSECAAQHPEGNPKANDVLINNGKLQNAVVYVKDGLGDRVFAVSCNTSRARSARVPLYAPDSWRANRSAATDVEQRSARAQCARVVEKFFAMEFQSRR